MTEFSVMDFSRKGLLINLSLGKEWVEKKGISFSFTKKIETKKTFKHSFSRLAMVKQNGFDVKTKKTREDVFVEAELDITVPANPRVRAVAVGKISFHGHEYPVTGNYVLESETLLLKVEGLPHSKHNEFKI